MATFHSSNTCPFISSYVFVLITGCRFLLNKCMSVNLFIFLLK